MRIVLASVVLLAGMRPIYCGEEEDRAKALKAALAQKDLAKVRETARELAKLSTSKSAQLLSVHLELTDLAYYWTIVEAMAYIQKEEGLKAILDRYLQEKSRSRRRDLLWALLANRTVAAGSFLASVSRASLPEDRSAVIDELVSRESKDSIPLLIEILEQAEKSGEDAERAARAAKDALKILTGVDAANGAAWKKRWDMEKDTVRIEPTKIPDPKDRKTVVEVLRKNRRSRYEELAAGSKYRIVVVRGRGESVESVLDQVRIPYVTTTLKGLQSGLLEPAKAHTVLINCGADDTGGTGGKKTAEALRTFVEGGGYALGTDHALDVLLAAAFPEHLKAAGVKAEGTVPIYPAQGSRLSPLMRDVFDPGVEYTWFMEGGSAGAECLSAQGALLVASPKLASKRNPGAVACEIEHGNKGGRVLFIASHFAEQRRSEDSFTLQNLLLNFLIEAQENFRARGGK